MVSAQQCVMSSPRMAAYTYMVGQPVCWYPCTGQGCTPGGDPGVCQEDCASIPGVRYIHGQTDVCKERTGTHETPGYGTRTEDLHLYEAGPHVPQHCHTCGD